MTTLMPAEHFPSPFKHFSKYDFVESFVAATKDESAKAEEKIKAAIIADAIEEHQVVLFEHLATKKDLKDLELKTEAGLKNLEYRLTIKLATIMAALLTFLPLITEFFKKIL
jgi:hypothetical protein